MSPAISSPATLIRNARKICHCRVIATRPRLRRRRRSARALASLYRLRSIRRCREVLPRPPPGGARRFRRDSPPPPLPSICRSLAGDDFSARPTLSPSFASASPHAPPFEGAGGGAEVSMRSAFLAPHEVSLTGGGRSTRRVWRPRLQGQPRRFARPEPCRCRFSVIESAGRARSIDGAGCDDDARRRSGGAAAARRRR